jgi:hypothetical protein
VADSIWSSIHTSSVCLAPVATGQRFKKGGILKVCRKKKGHSLD